MSVVTQQARRRWAVVLVAVALLVCAPVLGRSLREAAADSGPRPSAAGLLRRALASASVPHSGLALSRGNLGLPDLPQLENVTSELGGDTRTRVWWKGPADWRTDVLTATGEQGSYDVGGRLTLWDYEQSRLTTVTGSSPVRLPRADDLLPPQAARRLLAGAGPGDRVSSISGRRSVAGVEALGIRIEPGDARSTIGHIDVWVDPVHALPVAITMVDTRGVSALTSQFLELELGPPSSSALAVPPAPGAVHDSTATADLAARLQQSGGRPLPDELAGVRASSPIVASTATYGSGLVRFVVLPLPGRLVAQLLTAARSGGATPVALPDHGAQYTIDPRSGHTVRIRPQAVAVGSGLVNLVIIDGSGPYRGGYLVTGLVTPQLLATAAGQLLERRP